MKPIHIIGQPGSGKTTLIVDIIEAMVKQNICVGSLKHSAHLHELDKPGKDSFRHRKAGASVSAMVNGEMAAIYLPGTVDITPRSLLENYFSQMDVVLIEGWISGPYDKIEVWRDEIKKPPIFSDISRVKAIVSSDPFSEKVEKQVGDKQLLRFKRNPLTRLVDYILDRYVS